MYTEGEAIAVAEWLSSVAKLKDTNHENRSGSLPAMCGLGMESNYGGSGTQCHALRLPFACASRGDDCSGTDSEEI